MGWGRKEGSEDCREDKDPGQGFVPGWGFQGSEEYLSLMSYKLILGKWFEQVQGGRRVWGLSSGPLLEVLNLMRQPSRGRSWARIGDGLDGEVRTDLEGK